MANEADSSPTGTGESPGGTPGGVRGRLVKTYRTLPSRIVGWGLLLGALVLAGLTVQDVVAGRADGILSPLALVAAVVSAGWVLFLRPSLRLHEDGLVMIDVLQDVEIPFAAVADISDQWSLAVVDREGKRHSSWAVPARRRVRPAQEIDHFGETTRRRASDGTTAQGVADELHRALRRWRMDGGEAAAGSARVTVRLAWPALVAIAITVLLVALALTL